MRFVVFNQKGGVGKSTITVNLAAVAAARGERTLVVDLDPQANATQYLLGDAAAEVKPNLADLFDESLSFRLFRTDPKLFVHPSPFPKLDVVPSHHAVSALVPKLEQRHKIFRVREIVDALGYPTVFFDTPPSDNVLTLSALVAADRVLVPFDCDDFARRAIGPVLERIEEARADHNPRLRVEGVVVNQFLGRANFPQQAVDALAGDGLRVLEPYISSSVRIRESHHAARPMVFFEAGHKVTGEFEALYGGLGRRSDRRRADKREVVAAS
jgi:chromosome partitioning protein